MHDFCSSGLGSSCLLLLHVNSTLSGFKISVALHDNPAVHCCCCCCCHYRYDLPINPGFNITVALHDSHAVVPVANGMYDCKHYCHPGVPQASSHELSR
jgi:hypothetical protein